MDRAAYFELATSNLPLKMTVVELRYPNLA